MAGMVPDVRIKASVQVPEPPSSRQRRRTVRQAEIRIEPGASTGLRQDDCVDVNGAFLASPTVRQVLTPKKSSAPLSSRR